MEPHIIIAQIIGIVAIAFSFVTYQMKSNRGVMVMLSLATTLFCIHYSILGATTGLVLNVVGIIRNICYCFKDKKILSSKIVPVILAAVMAVLSIFTWEGYHSVFFVVGITLNTLAMGYFTSQGLRKSILLTSTLILIYDALIPGSPSISGMLNETIAITSSIIGIFRFRKTAQNEQ